MSNYFRLILFSALISFPICLPSLLASINFLNFFLICFTSILVHELGHIFVLIIYRLSFDLKWNFLSIRIFYESNEFQAFLVSIGGIFSSFLFFLIFGIFSFYDSIYLFGVIVNFLLFSLNFFPFAVDGRIIWKYLWKK